MPNDKLVPIGPTKIARLEDFHESRDEQFLMPFLTTQLSDRQRYSNTVVMYDQMPKYNVAKVERIGGKFLESIERVFVCKTEREAPAQSYKLRVDPARLEDKDGVIRDYFPGVREELVEDALRKLAASGHATMLDEMVSVKFTLYQLKQELKRTGHSYSIDQLKDALMILGGTRLTVKNEKGDTMIASNMFETIGLTTREQWKGVGKKTSAFVRFNFLVDKAIRNRDFRLLNYEKAMSYASFIARQLYKRMSHHYRQANAFDARAYYTINLTTIIRDFGLKEYEWLSHNLRNVELALKEMIEKQDVLFYKVEKTSAPGKRGRLLDAKITIAPSPDFVKDIKRANQRETEMRSLPSGRAGH